MATTGLLAAATALLIPASLGFAQARVHESPRSEPDKSDSIRTTLDDNAAEFWIYDDIDAGFDESRRTGKPILLSIR